MYQSCRELELSLFIRCVVEEDYQVLVIEGTASAGELQSAWLSIYSEYCDLIGSVQIASMIRQVIEMAKINARIMRVQHLVACLQEMYRPGILGQLNECGYNIKHEPDNVPAFHQALKAALSKLNPQILRVKQLQSEQPKSDQARKATYEDFEMTLIEISEMQKYEVNDTITVLKYCGYVKKLKRQIETQKRNLSHGRKR